MITTILIRFARLKNLWGSIFRKNPIPICSPALRVTVMLKRAIQGRNRRVREYPQAMGALKMTWEKIAAKERLSMAIKSNIDNTRMALSVQLLSCLKN
jgi:hypothetical protein